LDAKDGAGNTALTRACNSRFCGDVVGDLLAAGAISLEALEGAVSNGYEQAVAMALGAGANANLRSTTGATMMHIAVVGGLERVVGLLTAAGADANATDWDDRTPLVAGLMPGG
jgi:ankyrin repeat protein